MTHMRSIGNISINKKINYKKISESFNFKKYFLINNKNTLKKQLKSFLKFSGPAFLEAKVNLGTIENLTRPKDFIKIKNNFIKK